ncbi:MAG: hypothetical protein RL138_181, partial [Bacteroidota bacterium]
MLYASLFSAAAFIIGFVISRLLSTSKHSAIEARAILAENQVNDCSIELKNNRARIEALLQEKSFAEQKVSMLEQQIK